MENEPPVSIEVDALLGGEEGDRPGASVLVLEEREGRQSRPPFPLAAPPSSLLPHSLLCFPFE